MALDLNTSRVGTAPIGADYASTNLPKEIAPQPGEFNSLLKDKVQNAVPAKLENTILKSPEANPLKFSSHALNRIRERGISMGKEQMEKLEKAVDTAAAKGAKDSLILGSDAAFIVSVKNRTVVTVVDRGSMVGNVFTNIDSTVVM